MIDRNRCVQPSRLLSRPWLAGVLLVGAYFATALFSVLLSSSAVGDTITLPALPCDSAGGPTPPFANPPHFRVWHRRDLAGWQPAACFGWPPGEFTIVTVLSGAFHFDGTGDDLLARFGAASSWTGIRYWSASDERWRTFITDQAAVTDASGKTRRPDFTLDELKAGADLYFARSDDRSTRPVIYRMHVDEATPDRVVVRVGNVSPVMAFIVTVFDAGDIRAAYILEKIAPGRWGYYAMTEMQEGFLMIGNHAEDYRAGNLAIFRLLAGIPTDREPAVTQ